MNGYLIFAVVVLAFSSVVLHMAVRRLIIQRREDAERIASLERYAATLSTLPLRVVQLEVAQRAEETLKR